MVMVKVILRRFAHAEGDIIACLPEVPEGAMGMLNAYRLENGVWQVIPAGVNYDAFLAQKVFPFEGYVSALDSFRAFYQNVFGIEADLVTRRSPRMKENHRQTVAELWGNQPTGRWALR